MNKITYNLKFLLVAMLFFAMSFEFVSADAWWGEGYRSPEWVRKNGGTTISYTVKGTSNTDKYKAMMFRDGKYIEVEFGKHATFDDAKNGTYLINFYKCKDCMKHKYDNKEKIRSKDKKVASITIVARPGEENTLIFDASTNTVKVVGRRSPIKVNPFIAQKKQAQENEGKICKNEQSMKESQRLEQFLLLTNEVDRNKFSDINKEVGILPQFIVKR
ncbi:MAG: hypothetical protein ACKUBY_00630 [Candidatus Moraniibacteriota bacterium]|jgi:hypothetical protein